jgi:hypothetical protein
LAKEFKVSEFVINLSAVLSLANAIVITSADTSSVLVVFFPLSSYSVYSYSTLPSALKLVTFKSVRPYSSLLIFIYSSQIFFYSSEAIPNCHFSWVICSIILLFSVA